MRFDESPKVIPPPAGVILGAAPKGNEPPGAAACGASPKGLLLLLLLLPKLPKPDMTRQEKTVTVPVAWTSVRNQDEEDFTVPCAPPLLTVRAGDHCGRSNKGGDERDDGRISTMAHGVDNLNPKGLGLKLPVKPSGKAKLPTIPVYAGFEHSLVQELGYDTIHRI
jgi:hypothetical protein